MNRSPNGLLVLNKPPGMSSRKACAIALKSLPRKLKRGHVGTLDPMANGVLPVLIGKATRCMDYLHTQTKQYRFTAKLGVSTTTLDAEGEVLSHVEPPKLSETLLLKAGESLLGKRLQVPPLYSAIKFKGKPLYEYARTGRGDEVCLEDFARQVDIKELVLEGYTQDTMTWSVQCTKGTYVRVLAVEIAELLDTTCHVEVLTRVKSSGFSIDRALDPYEIADNPSLIEENLLSISELPLEFPSWKSSESLIKKLLQGQSVSFDTAVFCQSLIDSDKFDDDESRLLLIGENGQAFGLGIATKTTQNRVKLHLNKGLI